VNEELRRKLQQGSQQTQGEVLELELEEQIRATFPFDQIDPVPKGMNGADVIQRVHNKNGHCCGTIVWESRRTKGWSEGWIQKLKDDLRLVKGDIAIIVSEALPKEVKHFAHMKGVWITSRDCALTRGLHSRQRAHARHLTRKRRQTAGCSSETGKRRFATDAWWG
jgi:hypothetical protein